MFSLVICTLGRIEELETLLTSLTAQTEDDFEIVIVDQNPDERLESTISKFRDKLDLQRLRSPVGLSRGRNRGLAAIKGDIVAFPDDDCTYPPDLLAEVRKRFQMHSKADGITVASEDANGRSSGPRWATEAGPVTKEKVWRQAVSYTIFLRRSVIEAVGKFDEQLGVGASSRWQAGEETDYLLRALDKNLALYFDPSLHAIHSGEASEARIRKAHSYGFGLGRVVAQHRYPTAFKLKLLCGPTARALFYGVIAHFHRATVECAVLTGRLRGLLSG